MRASDADRERVARILHDAMAEGRLTVTELEERLDALYAAKTFADLEPLTADLPVPAPGPLAVAQPRMPAAPEERIGGVPSSSTAIAVMSGSERKGPWVAPRQFTAVAVMGGVVIDLTKARFAEREVTITCFAMMAGIDVIVPEDVHVRVNGVGLLGAFEDRSHAQPAPDAPVVRINGLALMGGVDVHHPKRKKEKRKHIGH
jgi:hypothetical protein